MSKSQTTFQNVGGRPDGGMKWGRENPIAAHCSHVNKKLWQTRLKWWNEEGMKRSIAATKVKSGGMKQTGWYLIAITIVTMHKRLCLERQS